MNKEYFLQLAEYNIWSNKIVSSWFEKISEKQWKQNIVSSFNSIESTALHIAAAEKIWFERLSKLPISGWLPDNFTGSKSDAVKVWEESSQNLKKLMETFDESLLAEKLTYKNIKGIEFTLPYYQMFMHVFNHSTYHRGQLVTMLRQVGFTEISSLDMTTYFIK